MLDRAIRLVSLLGSHWAGSYDGTADVATYIESTAELERHTEQLRDEALDAISRHTVPLQHTEQWYPLTLLESNMNSDGVSMNYYGAGYVYGEQPDTHTIYQYGVPSGLGWYSFELPTQLTRIPLLVDHMRNPTATWFNGLDYYVEQLAADTPRIIRFNSNPFESGDWDIVTLPNGDRSVTLWVRRGEFARNYVFQHLGYVLGLWPSQPDCAESADMYRQLLNAIFTSMVAGGSVLAIESLAAAISGAPVVIETIERVEYIQRDAEQLVIVTDRHAYRYAPAANPVVAVDDYVYAGQQLSDAYTIHTLNRGHIADSVRFVSVTTDMLATGIHNGLMFENKSVPLVVTTVDGRTRVAFELGGTAADVTQFFTMMHERGITSGLTLANMLDTREHPTGEPTAANMPATINPLQFMIQHVMRNHVTIIQWRPTQFGQYAVGLQHTRLFRSIVPPGDVLISAVELVAPQLTVTMDGTGGTAELPGHTQSATTRIATTPIPGTVSASSVSGNAATSVLGGRC